MGPGCAQPRIARLPKGGQTPNTEGTMVMRTMCQFVANFLRREDGPTAVEYAVMLALIITVCVSAVTALGGNTRGSFQRANNIFVTGS